MDTLSNLNYKAFLNLSQIIFGSLTQQWVDSYLFSQGVFEPLIRLIVCRKLLDRHLKYVDGVVPLLDYIFELSYATSQVFHNSQVSWKTWGVKDGKVPGADQQTVGFAQLILQ